MLNVSQFFRQEVIPKDEHARYNTAKFFLARRLLILSAFGIAALSSCNPDRDKDGIPDEQDKCPAVYSKTNGGCPPEQKINAVRFFIDRSGSMSGYYKGETEFVDANDDVLAKVDSKSKIKEIWLVSDSAELFPGNADAFREQVLRTQPKEGKSSMMDDIFETISLKTDTNDIAVFVSDGILSYPNKDILINRNINKEKASALGSKIYSIFHNKLKNGKRFSTSVYAFKSAFNGYYFNYQNGKVKLSGEPRPYYMWVIGRKELLRKFNAELSGFSTFSPLAQLHFGLEDSAINKASFIPSIERSGEWSLSDDGQGVNHIGKNPAKFCLALDLSTLPPYVRNMAYLNKHIHLDATGCTASFQVKDKSEISTAKLKGNRQKEAFASSTHLLIIDVTQMATERSSVTIILPALPDTWYKNWSCDDDLNPKRSCTEQTFAFSYLIDGIIQAYQSDHKNYINTTISLQQ